MNCWCVFYALADLRLWLSGRAKVHWTKTKHTGKISHVTHYRAEEIFVNHTLILFGTSEYCKNRAAFFLAL